MLIVFTYLPGFVSMVFRGMPTVWRGRHRLIFCWLIFMQAVSPGRKTLEEMARWTPATITAWRFGRLLKAAYWNVHLIVKIPAASGGALEGRSLSCWGNLSPKPPNKDAIPPHRKQWGILASFREPYTGHTWCLLSWEAQYTIIGINSNVPWSKNIGLRVKTRRTMKTRKVKSSWNRRARE